MQPPKPKRIKPDEVVAAYKQKGLKARTIFIAPHHLATGPQACCGIGALLAAIGINDTSISSIEIAEKLGVPTRYVTAFFDGFDSGEAARRFNADGVDAENGFEDGMAAREAVTQADLWLDPNNI